MLPLKHIAINFANIFKQTINGTRLKYLVLLSESFIQLNSIFLFWENTAGE